MCREISILLDEIAEKDERIKQLEQLHVEPNSMDKLQHEINDWQKKTFPHADKHSVMSHLEKEIKELRAAIDSNDPNVGHEMADCQHLLFGLAAVLGSPLYLLTVTKFKINQNRKWGEPDKDGVVEHIHAEEEAKLFFGRTVMKMKIGRHEYEITGADKFMDNGACVQLMTQSKEKSMWGHRCSPILSEKLVKAIKKLKRTVHLHNYGEGVTVFSIQV